MSLVLLFCLAWLSSAGQIRYIAKDLTAGIFDTKTGATLCSTSFSLPQTQCVWELGDGTRGQTSAVFYMNQTQFFLIQENCGGSIGKTQIIQAMGPFCRSSKIAKNPKLKAPQDVWFNTRPMSPITTTAPINELNMAWDHTCNVVVLAPRQTGNLTIIETRQCSEYDGAVRMRPNYAVQGNRCQNCWRKVPGVGALDFGAASSIWNPELNCGESCVMYTVEERLVNGQPTKPRVVVGRTFREGTSVSNVTDALQAQTLSYNPWARRGNQFLGIGVCCTQAWCSSSCLDFDGHAVVFSFTKGRFQILADLGADLDPTTVKLGVEFSSIGSQRPREIYVASAGAISTFAVETSDDGLVLSAIPVGKVPVANLKSFSMWVTAQF